MNNNIKHQGIIDKINVGSVKVRIVQTSACASCQLSGKCNSAESKVKLVDVSTADVSAFSVGDSVTVVASGRTGLIAVMLTAVFPLVVMVAVLSVVLAITGNEVAAALGGIASLIPYYIIIYMLRHRISESVSFHIESVRGVSVPFAD